MYVVPHVTLAFGQPSPMKRFLSTEASERLTARNPAEHYILTYDTHSYYPRGNHFGWLSPSLSVSKKPD